MLLSDRNGQSEWEIAERQETKLVLEGCLHFLAGERPKAVLGEIFQDNIAGITHDRKEAACALSTICLRKKKKGS